MRIVARRLGLSIPLLFAMSALVFVLMSLVPGSVAYAILGYQSTLQAREQLTRELGLNQSIFGQWWQWFGHAIHGDLGTSLITGVSVTSKIATALPVTLSLIIGTVIVSVLIGVTIGVATAARSGFFGRLIDSVFVIGLALPSFWLGAELIILFAVKVHLFPATGYVTPSTSVSQWLRSLVLPVTALAIGIVGWLAKFTRTSMLDALSSEYVRMARGNGIAEWSIVYRHAFKAAAIQVVTVAGLVVVGLLIGTVFVENVFGLPGLGALVVTAVTDHDIPLVEGIVITFTLIVIAVNLVIDLCYGLLDPRVRTA